MELKIEITKMQHLYNNGEYLVAKIYLNGNYFKEVIPEQSVADVEQLLNCVVHSIVNDEDFKKLKIGHC
jgi:hypothetical protein